MTDGTTETPFDIVPDGVQEGALKLDDGLDSAERNDEDNDDADDDIDDGDVDGRTLRRTRNRDAVIAALIALVREGDPDPTVANIADRAGVSHRSIFRYFDDLNDLAKTAIETELRNVWPLSIIPDIGEGPLDRRIDKFLDRQFRVIEYSTPLVRVARSKAVAIPAVGRALVAMRDLRVDTINKQFALELEQMATEQRGSTAIAISMLVSSDSLETHRRLLGATDEEIIAGWRAGVHKLLA